MLKINFYLCLLTCFFIFFITLSCNEKESIYQAKEASISIRSVVIEQEDSPTLLNPEEDKPQSNPGPKMASLLAANTNKDINNITRRHIVPAERGEMIYGKEFDALIGVEGHQLFDSTTRKDGINKVAANVPISNTMKFRLLIFLSGNLTSPVANVVLGAGEAPNIQLNGGSAYTWYAVSTNDGVAPNVSSSGMVSSADLQNKDFMFATGSLTLATGQNYLQIVFKRQMTAINVNLNTRGLFGPMLNTTSVSIGQATSGSGFNPIIRTGNFNIFNATFSGLTTISPVLSASSMAVVDSRWGNAEKVGTFYSAENPSAVRSIAANQLRVRLNSLSITMDDNSTRTFATNTTLAIPHNTALTLQKGRRSRANVRLVESAVLVGGVRWARTNLVYNPSKLYGSSYVTGQSDAYRFRPSNNYTAQTNIDYWNHTTFTPTGTDYRTYNQCYYVYPEGTWDSPSWITENSDYHFLKLISQPNEAERKNIGGATQYRIKWKLASNQVNNIYPDPTELILPLFGYRTASGNIVGRPTSTTSSARLDYWSMAWESTFTSLPGYQLFANGNSGVPSSISNLSVRTAPVEQGRSMRCIRE